MGEIYLPWDMDKVIYKLKMTIMFLIFHDTPLEIKIRGKNMVKACMYNEEGDEKCQSIPGFELAEIYTKAVCHAEIDSIELARSYGNRSAVLYNGGLYKHALMDIERALELNYDSKERCKLYDRKARCLILMKGVTCPEVDEAIAHARLWTNELDEVSRKQMISILDNYPGLMCPTKVWDKYDTRDFIPSITSYSSSLLGASDAIDLRYFRHPRPRLVATRNIAAGETIWIRKSHSSIIDYESLYKYCWNCSKRAWSSIPCNYCANVVYCNEECRDNAWGEHHHIECPIINVILDSIVTKTKAFMALRLTVKAYKEAGTIRNLQEKINRIKLTSHLIEEYLTEGVFDDSKYLCIWPMRRSYHDAIQYVNDAAIILRALAATTNIFGEEMDSYNKLLGNNEAMFMGALITTHFGITLNAREVIVRNDGGDENIKRGLMMNPFTSIFNHSCDPMMMVHIAGDVISLIALQNLKKDDPICIHFDKTFFNTIASERKNFTRRIFGTQCRCTACFNNWGPGTFLTFLSFQIQYPPALAESLEFIKSKYPDEMTWDVVPRKDKPLIISNLFRMVNIHQQTHGYPTRDILEFKMLLIRLYSSLCC